MYRYHQKRRKFMQATKKYRPHIFATGAVLSALATAIATASGVAQFREIFGLGTVMVLATATFIAAFFGTILLKRNK